MLMFSCVPYTVYLLLYSYWSVWQRCQQWLMLSDLIFSNFRLIKSVYIYHDITHLLQRKKDVRTHQIDVQSVSDGFDSARQIMIWATSLQRFKIRRTPESGSVELSLLPLDHASVTTVDVCRTVGLRQVYQWWVCWSGMDECNFFHIRFVHCFSAMRIIRSVRRSVSKTVLLSFVLSWLLLAKTCNRLSLRRDKI